ncbi:asparagine synthase (glutamine-hydrolyzing) [Gammaproteobacteria bacterium]|nr:asparagine synthase (glutamine-hydrolyzing) [Gammaproteobacteria bacterium]
MCGLTGILCSEPNNNISSNVSKMNSFLTHRGPDDDGIWYEENIGLGHRRLAILDLSISGAQPMHSNCGRYVLAYNGEVYNHHEIRNQLKKEDSSIIWCGHSDTETLLAAILQWGLDETLVRTHGMFALAMWDRKENRLSLARDRMGEKPLYWGWAGSDLVFGSEIKSLRAHPEFSSEICHKALSQYLSYMYVPAPRSIHPNIFKLEPGTILDVDKNFLSEPPQNPIRPGESYGSISIRRYWYLNEEIEAGAENQILDQVTAIPMLENVLSKAVERQMISDVPLGAFLSGGIDSSMIVSLMQKQSIKPIKTFTIGFEEAHFDESPHAAAVASHLGTEHETLMVTEKQARDVIPDLPELYDEPFADSSQIPTYLVCCAAKQNVTVALSGDGGDELFGGYSKYLWGPNVWDRFKYMPYSMRCILGNLINVIPINILNQAGQISPKKISKNKNILGDKLYRLADRLKKVKTNDDLYRSLITEWPISSGILKNVSDQYPCQLDDPLPKIDFDHPATHMMIQDMRSYLPDDILCKVDRAAMGVSLEVRTPFLDPEVIKFSSSLPLNFKISNGEGKWILRQILYKHVPQSIIDRPKSGFGIPIGIWLRGPLREWAEELLSYDRISNEGFFNPDIVSNIWKDHISGRRDWTTRLWAILMFQAWYARQL